MQAQHMHAQHAQQLDPSAVSSALGIIPASRAESMNMRNSSSSITCGGGEVCVCVCALCACVCVCVRVSRVVRVVCTSCVEGWKAAG